jgi:hypothetical protein
MEYGGLRRCTITLGAGAWPGPAEARRLSQGRKTRPRMPTQFDALVRSARRSISRRSFRWKSPAYPPRPVQNAEMVMKMRVIHDLETTYAECRNDHLRFGPIRDSWVVYHGTSSVFEQDIEDRGLEPFNRLFDPRDVDRVRDAFHNLGWYGSADSGYVFLASYSRDRHRGDRQCVYCCSSPDAGLLFSTREFAGGETARQLRKAFRELERLVSTPDLCDAVRRRLVANPRARGVDCDPDEVLASVSTLLTELGPRRDNLERLVADHKYGVVYAVQLQREHLPFLVSDNATDLGCRIPIHPDRLVGRARIHDERPEDADCVYSDPEVLSVIEDAWTPFGMIPLFRKRQAALLKELEAKYCPADY